MNAYNENNPNTTLDADRLFQASEALIEAIIETATTRHGANHPLELFGTPHQPKCLAGYTRAELEQACEFLARMGYIDSRFTRRDRIV